MGDLFDKDFENLFDSRTGKLKKRNLPKKTLSNKNIIKKIDKEIDADLDEAKVLGQWEMDQVHSAYTTFLKEIADLAVFQYLKPFLLKFGETCECLDALVCNDVESLQVEEEFKEIFGNVGSVRVKLLVDIYNRYKNTTNDIGDFDDSSVPF